MQLNDSEMTTQPPATAGPQRAQKRTQLAREQRIQAHPAKPVHSAPQSAQLRTPPAQEPAQPVHQRSRDQDGQHQEEEQRQEGRQHREHRQNRGDDVLTQAHHRRVIQ